MREADRIVQQLERSFRGEAWSGPSLLESLAGVTHAEALAHPLGGSHSIWELVLHLGGTYRLVLRRLQGEAAELIPEEDWPDLPEAPDEAEWEGAITRLESLHREVVSVAGGFRDDDLTATPTPPRRYTAYDQLHGLAHHNLYHAGQIILLARAARSGD